MGCLRRLRGRKGRRGFPGLLWRGQTIALAASRRRGLQFGPVRADTQRLSEMGMRIFELTTSPLGFRASTPARVPAGWEAPGPSAPGRFRKPLLVLLVSYRPLALARRASATAQPIEVQVQRLIRYCIRATRAPQASRSAAHLKQKQSSQPLPHCAAVAAKRTGRRANTRQK